MSGLRILASTLALSAAALLASCSTATQDTTQTAAVTTPAGPHPGEGVYKQHCASCHDNPELTKAPTRETLARMTSGMITNALMTGKMIPQATMLSSQQVSYVSDYLSEAAVIDDSWMAAMRCPANRRTPRLTAAPTVQTFGFDIRNRRNLSYAQAGLKPADFSNLEVAWVVGFPDVVTMRSQAAVVGNTIFLPVGENALHNGENKPFAEVHHVFITGVGDLGLDHPEFREVATRFRFLRAERRAECVALAERRSRGFIIKLAGLRQICLVVAKVIDLK